VVPGDHVQVLRDVLGGRGRNVAFADMAVLGRNPSRPSARSWTSTPASGSVAWMNLPGRAAALRKPAR
jgi:hypothetical protein